MLFYAVERREVASHLDAPLAHECFFIDEQGRCVTFLCTSGAGVSPVHAPAGQGCCLLYASSAGVTPFSAAAEHRCYLVMHQQGTRSMKLHQLRFVVDFRMKPEIRKFNSAVNSTFWFVFSCPVGTKRQIRKFKFSRRKKKLVIFK